MARLEGIQRSLCSCRLNYLLELEIKVQKELHEALSQEESLLRQKSHMSWLQASERNTKFFYLSVLNRRRQIKGYSIERCLGTVVHGPTDLEEDSSGVL